MTNLHHTLSLCLGCILFLSGDAAPAAAQEQPNTITVRGDANSCELNSLHLNSLVQEARANSERVFVIARLGRGERAALLNRLRLDMARFQLMQSGRLPKGAVIFAEGDSTDGEGRLEFYLGSRLYLVSLARRGENVCLTCCDDRPSPGEQSGITDLSCVAKTDLRSCVAGIIFKRQKLLGAIC